jgi:hypothetical protein
MTVIVVKQHMPWDGLNGAELDAGRFERGERAEKHDRKEHRSTQVWGSRKDITPLLLLYWLYIFGSMEYATMVLPSSLLEEEDELLSVGTLKDQPLTRAPCATLYSGGQGYNGHMRPGDTNYAPNRTC